MSRASSSLPSSYHESPRPGTMARGASAGTCAPCLRPGLDHLRGWCVRCQRCFPASRSRRYCRLQRP
ncbi:hypothetical protein KC333_g191 [Hortaea werneckii]|nr:hypothetical protein KC333_g191 [Hortaea werneckii]